MKAIFINSLEDLKRECSHPYRSGEYLTDGTNVYPVEDKDEDNEALIETFEQDELMYMVNWEGDCIYTECGVKIEPVYG